MRKVFQIICIVLVLLIYFLFPFLKKDPVQHEQEENLVHHEEEEVFLPGWEKNVSRDVNDYIVGDNFHLIPTNICDRPSLLLMIVCSSTDNIEARIVIRETWGQAKVVLGKNVSVYFLVGETTNLTVMKQLKNESYKFGDIIQGNFLDSYNNLTLKSIYMLNVATRYCFNNTNFLLKVDDDVLLSTEKLIQILKEMEDAKNILMGKLISGAIPIKDPSNKWFTPNYMFKDSVFPNYVSGACYLMSMDVAKKIFQITRSTPIFHIEDVYLTGICAKKAGIRQIDNIYFSYQYSNHGLCDYVHCIALHNFNPKMITNSFNNMSNLKIVEKCKNHKPKFNAHNWVVRNIRKNHKNHKNKQVAT